MMAPGRATARWLRGELGIAFGDWRLARAALAVAVILPLVPVALWSIASVWRYPVVFPSELTLDAWRAALDLDGRTMSALVASVSVGLPTAIASVLIAWPVARRHALRATPSADLLLLAAPAFMPQIAVGMGIHAAFLRLGMADTYTGVVVAHLIPAAPYTALILTGAMRSYDAGWEEQARSLGADRLQIARRVTLPLLAPSLALAGAVAFIVSWGQYLTTLLVGGGTVVTLPLHLYALVGSGEHATAAAMTFVYLTPAWLLLAGVGWMSGRAWEER